MKIFITGGAGYIGTAVSRELVEGGHELVALARSDAQESRIRSVGATAVRGDLRDPQTYASHAAAADAIVHLAAPSGADRAEIARAALRALLDAARSGHVRSFVYTSVLFVLGDVPGGADESSPPAGDLYQDRAALEAEVLSAADGRLSTSVVRPGMVYGGGEGGSVSEMFRSAMADGLIRFAGEGGNRWPLVHRADVAALFRLVVEKSARGIFHATDNHPLPVRDVAQLAAAAAGGSIRVEGMPLQEARQLLGTFAEALCLDQPVASLRSRDLGWSPGWLPFPASAPAAFAEFVAEQRRGLGAQLDA